MDQDIKPDLNRTRDLRSDPDCTNPLTILIMDFSWTSSGSSWPPYLLLHLNFLVFSPYSISLVFRSKIARVFMTGIELTQQNIKQNISWHKRVILPILISSSLFLFNISSLNFFLSINECWILGQVYSSSRFFTTSCSF